jgi:hypothetical protein
MPAGRPVNPVKDIRSFLYRPERKLYQFWKPRLLRVFIIDYTDGTGRVYQAKAEKV